MVRVPLRGYTLLALALALDSTRAQDTTLNATSLRLGLRSPCSSGVALQDNQFLREITVALRPEEKRAAEAFERWLAQYGMPDSKTTWEGGEPDPPDICFT